MASRLRLARFHCSRGWVAPAAVARRRQRPRTRTTVGDAGLRRPGEHRVLGGRIQRLGDGRVMKPRQRSTIMTVLVFTGFGVLSGIAGAAVLGWFASQPFDVYTAGYQPLDFASVRIDSPSPFGYTVALVLGGGVLGALVDALLHRTGWSLTRRTPW